MSFIVVEQSCSPSHRLECYLTLRSFGTKISLENDMVSDRCARLPSRPVGLLIVFVHVFMLAVTVVPLRMLSARVVRLSQMSIPAL